LHRRLICGLLIAGALFWIARDDQQSVGMQRGLVDTVGFAQYGWQMDSLLARIWLKTDLRKQILFHDPDTVGTPWKVVIAPHDDYTYVGSIYPQLLHSLTAKTLLIFGVAHKARVFKIEDKLVFDSFTSWSGPYQPVSIARLRESLLKNLPEDYYLRHDSLVAIEHSIEALLPFIQYFQRSFEIVPILVPAMTLERMHIISRQLATALAFEIRRKNWQWGRDFAIVISSDAVHYGDQDWGGKNYAPYGTDRKGYTEAVTHERNLIYGCLTGALDTARIARFVGATVRQDDYLEYQWTWCGRYSVPFGLLTAYYLQNALHQKLNGNLVAYSTSIEPPQYNFRDLNLGVTAPANLRHWVGYAALGFR